MTEMENAYCDICAQIGVFSLPPVSSASAWNPPCTVWGKKTIPVACL